MMKAGEIIICTKCPCCDSERNHCGLTFHEIRDAKVDGNWETVSDTCGLEYIKWTGGIYKPEVK